MHESVEINRSVCFCVFCLNLPCRITIDLIKVLRRNVNLLLVQASILNKLDVCNHLYINKQFKSYVLHFTDYNVDTNKNSKTFLHTRNRDCNTQPICNKLPNFSHISWHNFLSRKTIVSELLNVLHSPRIQINMYRFLHLWYVFSVSAIQIYMMHKKKIQNLL